MSYAIPNAEVLRHLPLFAPLSSTEFTWLLPSIRRRTFPARTPVLRAGEPSDGLYVVVSGRVRLVHHDQEGRALIAETFGPQELCGEMGLLDGTPAPASLETAEASELIHVPRESVLEFLNSNPAAAMYLLRVALERLCKAHRQMANLALTKVYGRVVQVLLDNGHEAEGEWHVDVGSEQIAAMVGASREMVSRVLRCMIEKRVLRRHKRKLIVIDREALRAASAERAPAARTSSAAPALGRELA